MQIPVLCCLFHALSITISQQSANKMTNVLPEIFILYSNTEHFYMFQSTWNHHQRTSINYIV